MSTPNIERMGEMDLWIHLRETFTSQGGTLGDLRSLLDPKERELGVRKLVGLCRNNPEYNLGLGMIRVDWTRDAFKTGSELTLVGFRPNDRTTAQACDIGFVSIADLKPQNGETLLTILQFNSTQYDWCGGEVALGFREQPHLFPFTSANNVVFPATALQNARDLKFVATYQEPREVYASNIGGCWADDTFSMEPPSIGIAKRTMLAYWKR